MALLEGLSEEVLQTVARICLSPERRPSRGLCTYGYKTAILSGGFTFWELFAKEMGIDYVHANELK
jgi:phosphoserine phosphatase